MAVWGMDMKKNKLDVRYILDGEANGLRTTWLQKAREGKR